MDFIAKEHHEDRQIEGQYFRMNTMEPTAE
jgi:hypothetical protein